MIVSYGVINDRSPHLIADLFEIVAIFENREVSRGDIETYLANEAGKGLVEELEGEAGHGASTAEVNEKFQRLSEEVFLHLQYRQVAFGDWYPFTAEADVLTPNLPLSDKTKLYVSLLVYSRLKMVSNSNRSIFAAKFEALSVEAVKGLFPNWDVYRFGKGGADRAVFGNKLSAAIRVLATKLKDTVDETYIAEIDARDTGDAGIDIVAVNELADIARGVPAFFGQCAAQQLTWPEKKFEASAKSIGQYIHFFHDPGTMLIIPVFYRNPDGKWVKSDGWNSILIDRLRLIKLLDTLPGTDPLAAAVATIPAALAAALPQPVAVA